MEEVTELTLWLSAGACLCISRRSCLLVGALQGSAHQALAPIAFGRFEGFVHPLKKYGGELRHAVLSCGTDYSRLAMQEAISHAIRSIIADKTKYREDAMSKYPE